MTLSRPQWIHVLAILTVGLPFCAFKALAGRILLGEPGWQPVGIALLALAAVDLALNLASLGTTLAGRGNPTAVCALEVALARVRRGHEGWRRLGLSLDAMLSFALVALVVGLDLLPRLPRAAAALWAASVVLNVLGAGIGRLAESLWALGGSRVGEVEVRRGE